MQSAVEHMKETDETVSPQGRFCSCSGAFDQHHTDGDAQSLSQNRRFSNVHFLGSLKSN